jgi:hypothetical protein
LGERIAFLAPSYYRGWLKALQQAGQGGAAGRIARTRIAGLATGVLVLTAATLYAMRERGYISDEEFEERMDPTKGKFLMVPIDLGEEGKRVEVGFGGFYVSMVRTLANMTKEDATVTGEAGRWYRGHAGTAPRILWDVTSGEDYQGNPVTTGEAVAKGVLPLAAQQSQYGEGTSGQRYSSAAAGAFGLRAYPEAQTAPRTEALRQMAKERYDRPWDELSIREQATLVRRRTREFGDEKAKSTPAAEARGNRAKAERQEALTRAVGRDTRDRLRELNEELPSYDITLSLDGAEVPLSKDRQAEYGRLLAEEYDRSVAAWDMDRLRSKGGKAREDFVKRSLTRAKERAKRRLIVGSRRQLPTVGS